MDCLKKELEVIPENIIYSSNPSNNNSENFTYLSKSSDVKLKEKKSMKIINKPNHLVCYGLPIIENDFEMMDVEQNEPSVTTYTTTTTNIIDAAEIIEAYNFKPIKSFCKKACKISVTNLLHSTQKELKMIEQNGETYSGQMEIVRDRLKELLKINKTIENHHIDADIIKKNIDEMENKINLYLKQFFPNKYEDQSINGTEPQSELVNPENSQPLVINMKKI